MLIRENRLKCVDLLLERRADTKFATEKLKMTAMHWAAFHGDDKVVKLLLDKGTEMTFTTLGQTPVDVAGFSNLSKVVEVFCEHLASKIDANKSPIEQDGYGGVSMTDGDRSQVINDNNSA